MQELTTFCVTNIRYAQANYEEFANWSRNYAPIYAPGDLVWINTKNFETRRPTKKFDHKYIRPYPILQKISTHSYKVDLPPGTMVHNVFHVSLLRPDPADPLPGQVQPPPPPIAIFNPETEEEENEWEVEYVANTRVRRGHLQYLVFWIGYHQPTWEPLENLDGCPDKVDEFYRKYPNKPGCHAYEARRSSLNEEGGGVMN